MRINNNLVAVPSNAFEHKVLKMKYKNLDGNMPMFENLPNELVYQFLVWWHRPFFMDSSLSECRIYKENGLWYFEYRDENGQYHDDTITAIPSNVDCIINAYRVLGKFRKVAALKRKYAWHHDLRRA